MREVIEGFDERVPNKSEEGHNGGVGVSKAIPSETFARQRILEI